MADWQSSWARHKSFSIRWIPHLLVVLLFFKKFLHLSLRPSPQVWLQGDQSLQWVMAQRSEGSRTLVSIFTMKSSGRVLTLLPDPKSKQSPWHDLDSSRSMPHTSGWICGFFSRRRRSCFPLPQELLQTDHSVHSVAAHFSLSEIKVVRVKRST